MLREEALHRVGAPISRSEHLRTGMDGRVSQEVALFVRVALQAANQVLTIGVVVGKVTHRFCQSAWIANPSLCNRS